MVNISLIDPPDGSTISGRVNVIFASFAGDGLARFDFFVDGKQVDEIVTARDKGPYVFIWNTRKYKNGPHSYTVSATSIGGETATAIPFNVVVQN